MLKHIIFCVETKDKNGSDAIYIKEIIKHFFKSVHKSVRIDYLYLHGKSGFKNKKKLDELKKLQKQIRSEDKNKQKTFFILDLDDITLNSNQRQLSNEVETFCKLNNYELIWFVPNIEKVLLGKSAKNKRAEAIKFREDNLITKVSKEKLVNPNPQYKESSNILYILQKHL